MQWHPIRFWLGLGNQEVKARYSRTFLGPLWMTFNLGFSITLVGFVFGTIFGMPAADFVPHLAVSLVIWNFMVSLLNEGARCYIDAAGYIKQLKQPLMLYFFMLVWKNIITLAHNMLVIPIVFAVFLILPDFWIILLPLNIILVVFSVAPFAIVIGVLSARYRDIPQIVANLMSALFFATPIVWKIELLGDKAVFAYMNPLTHLIEIVRISAFGQLPPISSYLVAFFVGIIGWLLAALVFSRFRSRIAYWM